MRVLILAMRSNDSQTRVKGREREKSNHRAVIPAGRSQLCLVRLAANEPTDQATGRSDISKNIDALNNGDVKEQSRDSTLQTQVRLDKRDGAHLTKRSLIDIVLLHKCQGIFNNNY